MNLKKLFPWRDEMFYRSATLLGKVIIDITAPFVYTWRWIKRRFDV